VTIRATYDVGYNNSTGPVINTAGYELHLYSSYV
jgi:hypothetical protein